MEKLFLHEEVLLLALKDEVGTVVSGVFLEQAICGAAIAELILNRSIIIEQVNKKKYIKSISTDKLGNKFLDECLDLISNEKKDYTVEQWINKLIRIKKIKHKAASGLVAKNILEAKDDVVLFVFNRTLYPELNQAPEQALIKRIEKAIFEDTDKVDDRTSILIALVDASGLLNVNLDKKALKTRKDRIKEIASGNLIGNAAKEVIEAARAAILITAIMPAVFAATVTTS